MKYEIRVGGETVKVDVRRDGEHHVVRVGEGPERRIRATRASVAELLLREGDASLVVGLHVDGERFAAQVRGHAILGDVVDARKAALVMQGGAGQGEVRTQMPGAVIRVPVKPGDVVHKGQVLVVVEAMKMENEFKSPIDGTIAAVHVNAGVAIEANTLLVTVAPA